MAGTPTPVGHDGRSPFHHGFPIGVGHVGHKNIAGLDTVHLTDVMHHFDRASANFLANSPPLNQYGTLALELVTLLNLSGRLAFYRFRPRLQNIQLTVDTILAPFNIHWPAIVFLDHQRIRCQPLDIRICQGIAIAQLGGHFGRFDKFAGLCFFLIC
ncbi:hypothetical protein GALL_526590 [mine drainage metagenome]|uniref:Uncharacterized protein n=1 Tax=mine drainage metagenome TaxID=410659 RepID=A0A1J5PKF8_9ZZZZ